VVFAGLVGAAVEDVLERAPVDVGIATHELRDRHRREVVGANGGEGTAVAAEGRADRVADVGVGHGPRMLLSAPMHSIKINDASTFPCAADDTILRAGLRAGLGLPYECNAGSCGTCRVELVRGEIDSIRPDAPG